MAAKIISVVTDEKELFYGQPCVGKTATKAPCEKKVTINVHTACKLCHKPNHCRNCHVAGNNQITANAYGYLNAEWNTIRKEWKREIGKNVAMHKRNAKEQKANNLAAMHREMDDIKSRDISDEEKKDQMRAALLYWTAVGVFD